MHIDQSPKSEGASNVIVLDEDDDDASRVIQMARSEGAITIDGDGAEVFWIIFSGKPSEVWDFNERMLRRYFLEKRLATA